MSLKASLDETEGSGLSRTRARAELDRGDHGVFLADRPTHLRQRESPQKAIGTLRCSYGLPKEHSRRESREKSRNRPPSTRRSRPAHFFSRRTRGGLRHLYRPFGSASACVLRSKTPIPTARLSKRSLKSISFPLRGGRKRKKEKGTKARARLTCLIPLALIHPFLQIGRTSIFEAPRRATHTASPPDS